MRDDAAATGDADLPRWIPNSGEPALPAPTAASPAPTAAADGVPGWNHGARGNDMPDSATAAANAEAVWRTRLTYLGALAVVSAPKILV